METQVVDASVVLSSDKEIESLRKEAVGIIEFAQRLKIKSQADREMAGTFVKTVRFNRDKLFNQGSRYVAIAFKAHKSMVAALKGEIDPWDQADTIVSQECIAWDREVKKLAEEREAKEREAALKKQKAEAEKEAKKLEKVGDAESAAVVRENALNPAYIPAAPKPAAPAAPGKTVENWDFKVTNAALIPNEYKIPDEVAIRKIVKAMKGRTNIPGIEVFDKGSFR